MIKQVLVLRHDLKCRRGKEIAQGAHAAIGALKQAPNNWVKEWEKDGCTKICVHVQDEKALLDLTQKVSKSKLPCYLVVDAGRTEFNGVHTFTALGIGPGPSELIDVFTGILPLL